MGTFTCKLCNYSTCSRVIWMLHLLLRKHRCRTLHYAASELTMSRWGNKGKSLILVAAASNLFSSVSGQECLHYLTKNSLGFKLLMHFFKEKGVVIEDIVWSSKDPAIAYLRFFDKYVLLIFVINFSQLMNNTQNK